MVSLLTMKRFGKASCLLLISSFSAEAFAPSSLSSLSSNSLRNWRTHSSSSFEHADDSSLRVWYSDDGFHLMNSPSRSVSTALLYSRSPSNHDFHDPFYQPQQQQQQQQQPPSPQNTHIPPFRYRPQRAQQQPQEPPTERFQFHQNVPRSSTFRERVNRRHSQEAQRSRTANPNHHTEPRTQQQTRQTRQEQQTQQEQTNSQPHTNRPRNPFRQQQQQAQAQAQHTQRQHQQQQQQQQSSTRQQQQSSTRYNTQRTQSQSHYQQAPHAPPQEDHRLEQDHYSLLGVHPDASPADIKKAYRALAKRFHPDVTTDAHDHEFFKLVNRAYQVLLSPESRQEFDQLYFQQGMVQGSHTTTTYPNTPNNDMNNNNNNPMNAHRNSHNPFAPPPPSYSTNSPFVEDEVEIVEPNALLVEEYMDEALFRPRALEDDNDDDDAPVYTQNGLRWKVSENQEDPEHLLLPGGNIRMTMEIDAKTAWQGGSQVIDVAKLQPCSACFGTGEGSGVVPCGDCGGTGQVVHHRPIHPSSRVPTNMWNHRTPSASVCPTCKGTGELPVDVCPTCVGSGSAVEVKQVPVTLPPGMEAGARVILQRQGHAGERGGPPGDLLMDIRIWEDPRFPRRGQNVFTMESVSYVHAILGGVLLVPLVDGRLARLEIPPGTQPGQVFVLQGAAGNPQQHHHPSMHHPENVGDHYVKIQVRIPTRITPHQRDLIRQLE